MGNKLTAFASLLTQAKPTDPPVLDMDAAAQEVVEEYILVWLRSRIMHNKQSKREISKDEVYTKVIEYMVNLNSSFFYARLWSESGIKELIWPPMVNDQSLLEFVYRGASVLHARVFGRTSDTKNPAFTALSQHLAESLCLMSATDDSTLIPIEMREVFPHYATLEDMFAANPWLVFIYYLSRVDILSLIEKGV